VRVLVVAVEQLAAQEAMLGEVASVPRGFDAREGATASVRNEQGSTMPAFPRGSIRKMVGQFARNVFSPGSYNLGKAASVVGVLADSAAPTEAVSSMFAEGSWLYEDCSSVTREFQYGNTEEVFAYHRSGCLVVNGVCRIGGHLRYQPMCN